MLVMKLCTTESPLFSIVPVFCAGQWVKVYSLMFLPLAFPLQFLSAWSESITDIQRQPVTPSPDLHSHHCQGSSWGFSASAAALCISTTGSLLLDGNKHNKDTDSVLKWYSWSKFNECRQGVYEPHECSECLELGNNLQHALSELSSLQLINILLDSIGFWRWCITHIIAGVLDFIHRPDFNSYKKKEEQTRRFGNWICFHPQVKGDTYSVGSLRKS
jgi:hypothetical protein